MKDFKILGVSYGVVGDLVMGLPALTYFEKKYPGSYKYWFIEKKVAFMAPLYLNHPLIDCIRITGEWSGFSREDYEIASTCDVKCTIMNWKHDELDWYNYRDQVEETARIAGIYDLKEVLTEEELIPKLYQWFDVGLEKGVNTYAKENDSDAVDYSKTIAIWPFATAGGGLGRSPSLEWWNVMICLIHNEGYKTLIFGHKSEPRIPNISSHGDYRHLSFFEQVKIALACKMSIGTDSGNMWVMGAYSHPAIHLLTDWLPGYIYIPERPLASPNKNSVNLFASGDINNIKHVDVLSDIERIMNDV